MRRYELTDDEWAIIEPLLPLPATSAWGSSDSEDLRA